MGQLDYESLLMRAAVSHDSRVQGVLASVVESREFKLDPRVLKFLDLALAYYRTTHTPLNAEVAGEYKPLVNALIPLNDPSSIIWAGQQLLDRDRQEQFSSILIKAMEILKVGSEYSGKGLASALDYLNMNMPRQFVESDGEVVDLRTEYTQREQAGHFSGQPTGFTALDELTDGQQKGELWIFGAYTGQGKSFLLQNILYNRRMKYGLRGALFSTEQQINQIKRRVGCLHSRDPKFNLPGGVKYWDVKRATLSKEQRRIWLDEVLPDWESTSYPECFLMTAPARSTIGSLFRRAEEIHSKVPLDFIIIDYLSQLRATSQRGGIERDQLSELIIESKACAMAFDDKRGIPVLTAAQTNPASWAIAQETGKYPLRAIADSAEAERSADLLAYLLRRPKEIEQRSIKVGVAKYRDGEGEVDFMLEEDFASSYLGDLDVPDRETSQWRIE